jgi:hypothetical protein
MDVLNHPQGQHLAGGSRPVQPCWMALVRRRVSDGKFRLEWDAGKTFAMAAKGSGLQGVYQVLRRPGTYTHTWIRGVETVSLDVDWRERLGRHIKPGVLDRVSVSSSGVPHQGMRTFSSDSGDLVRSGAGSSCVRWWVVGQS